MDVGVMIEGQENVTWDDWVALAEACEKDGVGFLFRSDHYLSVFERRERGSLDAWATISGLAAMTEKLRLGTLVSPVTFRHPSELAKVVVTADHISGGRIELGIGAGWMDREHEAYGFDLPPLGLRLDQLEEQMEIIAKQWGDGAFDFEGSHYTLRELEALPKPVQRPRPPLILGGRAGDRSLRAAARHADEYNTILATADEVRAIRMRLDAACEAEGRDPATLPLSMMTGWLVGADDRDLRDRAARLGAWKGDGPDADSVLASLPASTIRGTVPEALEQLHRLEEAGLARLMCQHLEHRDLSAIELIGNEIAPRLG